MSSAVSFRFDIASGVACRRSFLNSSQGSALFLSLSLGLLSLLSSVFIEHTLLDLCEILQVLANDLYLVKGVLSPLGVAVEVVFADSLELLLPIVVLHVDSVIVETGDLLTPVEL